MQDGIRIKRRSGKENMASYLDKLLRQEPLPLQAVLPPEGRDPQGPLPSQAQGNGVPSWDRAEASGDTDHAAGSWSGEPAESIGTLRDRSVARAAPVKAGGRAFHAGGVRSRAFERGVAVMIPVLAITFVAVVRYAFGPASSYAAKVVPVLPAAAEPVTDVNVHWELPFPYPGGGRDPMQSVGSLAQDTQGGTTQAEVRDTLVVTAVQRRRAGGPAVLIGPHWVCEGQAVPEKPGLTVKRIGDEGVEFSYNGGTWTQDAGQELDLRGILISKDRLTAVVGTQLVHKGEGLAEIPGLTIVEIGPDRVEFELGGQRWTQSVSSPATPPTQDVERGGS